MNPDPVLSKEINTKTEKIIACLQALSVCSLRNEFFKGFAKDPVGFTKQWMESQGRDMEVNIVKQNKVEFFYR